MTVDELIAALQALPPEQRARPVWVEGCDCIGAASTCEWHAEKPTCLSEPGYVLIARIPGS